MARRKKLYELADDDLARLDFIAERKGCATQVEALRLCIREMHRSEIESVAEINAIVMGLPRKKAK